ncbi:Reverse transcriptase domain-containing protein, partial [Aphis craccivora]
NGFRGAANVLASISPADLLARERELEFLWRRGRSNALSKEELRRDTIWDAAATVDPGSWTRRLIPDLSAWCTRDFGEVDFHLTQFLSGHGCFGHYLCRIKKVEQPNCVDCNDSLDNAEHAILKCDRWWPARRELEVLLSIDLTAETIVMTMPKSRSHWAAITNFVHRILSTREEEEQGRQRIAAAAL